MGIPENTRISLFFYLPPSILVSQLTCPTAAPKKIQRRQLFAPKSESHTQHFGGLLQTHAI